MGHCAPPPTPRNAAMIKIAALDAWSRMVSA
jgi:hypothetical protein